MSELGMAFWFVLAPLAIGDFLLLLLRLGDRDDALGRLGWSAALGSLTVGLVLLAASWFELDLLGLDVATAILLYVPFVVLVVHIARVERRRGPAPLAPPRIPTPPILGVASLLALVVALVHVIDASLVPALAGDEAMLWGYRARVIASEGGLGAGFVEAMADPALRHEDYPLLGSLLQAWVLDITGPGEAVLLRLPVQVCALGLVASLGSALRRHAGPWVAAALVVSFVALPQTRHALTSAGAEAAVALGLVLAADGWLRHRADGDERWLTLCATGLGLALFAKNDAQLFVLALVGGLVAARALTPRAERRPLARAAAAWALVPALVAGLGAAYNAWAGFENDLLSGKGSGRGMLARLADQPFAPAADADGSYLAVTARFFGEELLAHPRYDGLVLTLCLAALVVVLPRALRRRRATADDAPPATEAAAVGLGLAVAAGLVGLFLVYLTTPQPLAWHLASSAPRVAWQLVPLASLALAVTVSPRTDPWPDDVDSHRAEA